MSTDAFIFVTNIGFSVFSNLSCGVVIEIGLKVTFSILPVDVEVSFFTVSDLTVDFLVGFGLPGFVVVGFIEAGFVIAGLECKVVLGVVIFGLEVVRDG